MTEAPFKNKTQRGDPIKPKGPKFSLRKNRFCNEYARDLNAKQAAIRAGYSAHSAAATANKMMKDPKVREHIQAALDRRAARTNIKADAVLLEMAKVGFADMGEFAKWDNETLELIASEDLPAGATASVAEVVSTETAAGVKVTKIKLHSKLEALRDMARHLGMFVERVDVSGSVSIDAAVYEEKTLEELDEMLAAMRARPALEGEGSVE